MNNTASIKSFYQWTSSSKQSLVIFLNLFFEKWMRVVVFHIESKNCSRWFYYYFFDNNLQ